MKQSTKRRTRGSVPERTYSVAVVATMSAGKSTLLNAMIGRSLLPTSCLACTSSIFSIVDVDGASDFEVRSNARGRAKWIRADKPILAAMNSSARSTIELRGDLPGIANFRRGNVRVRFIDTPGPNNFEDTEHSSILQRALAKCDYTALIFLLDASSLHVTDELATLNQVKEFLNRKHGKIDVVFVLNRMDAAFEEDDCGKSLTEILENAKRFLTNRAQFSNPIVIPTWASLSLRLRRILNGVVNIESLSVSGERSLLSSLDKIKVHKKEIEELLGLKRCANLFKQIGTTKVTLPHSGSHLSFDEIAEAESLTGVGALESLIEEKMKKYFNARANHSWNRRKAKNRS